MWDVDVDRLYVLVNVNGNHWILLCISFKQRTIEVFDCDGQKRTKKVESFVVIISYIVEEVQSLANNKHMKISQYSVTYVYIVHAVSYWKSLCYVQFLATILFYLITMLFC